MIGKRLLYAPNIHQGGGRALLLPVLEALKDVADIAFVLDARMPLPKGVRLAGQVYRVKASLFSRLRFEWCLPSLINPDTLLLCMGNLPPLFAHEGVQQVFVQNRYLVDDVSLNAFPLSVRIRLMIERWWLKSNASYVNQFIVQTPTMQRLLKNRLDQNAEVLPFADIGVNVEPEPCSDSKMRYDFLYVASGEPHKEHAALLEAWVKLADVGEYPSLCLTLDANRFPDLCASITTAVKQHDLKITMCGECSYAEVQQLYRQSAAMIYPSSFESFGLPLIEAAMAGLPVLASNASYVHDVIEPSASFDPASPQSIANAVQRFTRTPAKLKIELLDANHFLTHVFNRDALT